MALWSTVPGSNQTRTCTCTLRVQIRRKFKGQKNFARIFSGMYGSSMNASKPIRRHSEWNPILTAMDQMPTITHMAEIRTVVDEAPTATEIPIVGIEGEGTIIPAARTTTMATTATDPRIQLRRQHPLLRQVQLRRQQTTPRSKHNRHNTHSIMPVYLVEIHTHNMEAMQITSRTTNTTANSKLSSKAKLHRLQAEKLRQEPWQVPVVRLYPHRRACDE